MNISIRCCFSSKSIYYCFIIRINRVPKLTICSIIEGKLEGQTEARLDSIKTIMRKLNQTVDEAMDTLDIEEKDRAKYRELINS